MAAGFHPDLTGRENVYLQGAILHMKRREVAAKFDQIVEFAGLQEFIDTPVKRYSSGMNARLGFSIAAHLEPDVLLIDEVLSVGDMGFQQRCIDRMGGLQEAGGDDRVRVAQPAGRRRTLCDRALYLHGGVRALGPARDVIEQYVRAVDRPRSTTAGAVEIVKSELLNEHGWPTVTAAVGRAAHRCG